MWANARESNGFLISPNLLRVFFVPSELRAGRKFSILLPLLDNETKFVEIYPWGEMRKEERK